MTDETQSARAGDGKTTALPYSMDLDPAGIRALVCDAITGALALGAQNESPAPEGHWLGHFWQLGRQHDEWRATVWAVARALNCLPSTFSDANGHVLRAAERLMAERAAAPAAAPEESNPNNCRACNHKKHPDGGWCYMFREEPTEVCAKHTARANFPSPVTVEGSAP